MKKNAFTLVELLAVIVILGIIMVIVGRNLTSTKKEANIKEIQKIEKTIGSLGADIYISYRNKFSSAKKYKVTLSALKGYLKNITCEGTLCKIKNPAGGDACEGYLLIDTTEEVEDMFSGYIDCGDDIYITDSIDINEYDNTIDMLD